MFIDLHLHESAYSPDSQMTLDELVQEHGKRDLFPQLSLAIWSSMSLRKQRRSMQVIAIKTVTGPD